MPSNFIEKYLGKSRRTKVALSLPLARLYPSFSTFLTPSVTSCLPTTPPLQLSDPPADVTSLQPRDRTVLERNIAFSSSRKQNPFLPLEHSVEIDSAYIGLPAASQTVDSFSFPLLLPPPRRDAMVFPLILCAVAAACRLLLSCTDAFDGGRDDLPPPPSPPSPPPRKVHAVDMAGHCHSWRKSARS